MPYPKSMSSPFVAVVFAALLVSACGGDESSNPTQNNKADTGVVTDAGSDTASSDLGGEDMATPDLSTTDDTGTDIGTDTGEDMGMNTNPTLADYFTCVDDVDCPVGLGNCVKTVTLNRADVDGSTNVPIQSIFSNVEAGSGVCSRDCTFDQTACNTLGLKDASGATVPFTCQVVVVGESAYPDTPPAFPFDGQLDAARMASGPSFGAVCRPPFELNKAHIEDLCGDCDATQGCGGTGVCWRFETNLPVVDDETGSCLEPIPTNGCPGGFESRELSDANGILGNFCMPIAETCGGCQDRDEDGRGAGHCANVETDCDDRNAVAYFDPSDMAHAFPSNCGDFDYNCNGLSDEAEQVGVAAYKAFHCEACYDDADGTTVLAGTAAEATLRCYNGAIIVDTCTDNTRVSCSGAPRTDGCESTAQNGGATYYVDADGDGFGDPAQPRLGCPTGPAPGDVGNDSDCNDGDFAIKPGAADLCECWGDCATLGARVDNNCDGSFDEGVMNYAWYPDADNDSAADRNAPNAATLYCGQPAPRMTIGLPAGPQADCADSVGNSSVYGAGRVLILDGMGGMVHPSSAMFAPPRDPANELYLMSGTAAAPEICDRKDNNCDGSIDEGVFTTYYLDADGDGFGDPNVTTQNCATPIALPPGNWVTVGGDCNDTPVVGAAAYPCDANGMNCPAEICDGLDNDCNGNIDGQNNNLVVGTGDNCIVTAGNPVGACRFGTQTSCSAGAWTCAPRAPLTFEDPNVPSVVTVSASNMTVLGNTNGDDDCDGPETVIYIDGTNGNDTNTQASVGSPLKTIGKALTYPNATEIRVSGTFNLDTQLVSNGPYEIQLRSGNRADIVGGWTNPNANQTSNNPWTWSNSKSEIQRPSNLSSSDNTNKHTLAIDARDVPAGVTLAYLDIQVEGLGTIPMGIDGYNHFGIYASNSPLVLHEVDIAVPTALDGASEATTVLPKGEDGHDGVATGPFGMGFGGDGTLSCLDNFGVSRNVSGGVGSANFAVPGGSGFGSLPGAGGVYWSGITLGQLETYFHYGKTGRVHQRGTCGDGGPAANYEAPSINGGFWKHNAGQSATKRGCNGSGGGGGTTWFNGRQGAGGGSGGCGGNKGISGGSGGSSFGLFALNSNIRFTKNVAIESGLGGHGGDGQSGSNGGNAGKGPFCYYTNTNDDDGCGNGGFGSPGNGGWGGAGGNGGSTFPVFSRGVDICNQPAATLTTQVRTNPAGDAGKGGKGGRGGLGILYDPYTGSLYSGDNGADAGLEGAVGTAGATRTCYVSTPCSTSDQCPTSSEECRADGWCYALPNSQPGLQTGYEVVNLSTTTKAPTCFPVTFPTAFGVLDGEMRVVVNSDQGYINYGVVGDPVMAWAENVTETGFTLCSAEQYKNDGPHREQRVAWIAFTDEGAKKAGLIGGRGAYPNSAGTDDQVLCDEIDLSSAGFAATPAVLFSPTYAVNPTRPQTVRTYAWGEYRTNTKARYCARSYSNNGKIPRDLYVDWLAFAPNNPPRGFRGGRTNFGAAGAAWSNDLICANVNVTGGCNNASCEIGTVLTSFSSDLRGPQVCQIDAIWQPPSPEVSGICRLDNFFSSWTGTLNADGTLAMCTSTDGGNPASTNLTANSSYIDWIAPLKYSAEVVSNPIPRTMTCGQTYTPSLTLRNTGFFDWTEASVVRLGSVTPGVGWSQGLGTTFPGLITRLFLPAPTTVRHGQQYSFPLTMVAPATAGVYDVEFQMVRDGFTWFGESVISQVTVTCP